MTFTEFVQQLPPVRISAARKDAMARRSHGERDPFATDRQRVLAARLVAQAEQKLGPLDLTDTEWGKVVTTLGGYSEADWRALASVQDLVPSTSKKRNPPRVKATPAGE